MKTVNQTQEIKVKNVEKKEIYTSLDAAFNAKHKKANDFIKKVKLSF